ncbi:hypothetical protein D3C75_495130 [compost metagenome]
MWVNNSSNNENSLFQTTNYTLILKYMLEVVNLQKNLHNAKVSVVARQLEDMFNNHVSSIDSILSARRNNLLG